jgi:hypothetical protein
LCFRQFQWCFVWRDVIYWMRLRFTVIVILRDEVNTIIIIYFVGMIKITF